MPPVGVLTPYNRRQRRLGARGASRRETQLQSLRMATGIQSGNYAGRKGSEA